MIFQGEPFDFLYINQFHEIYSFRRSDMTARKIKVSNRNVTMLCMIMMTSIVNSPRHGRQNLSRNKQIDRGGRSGFYSIRDGHLRPPELLMTTHTHTHTLTHRCGWETIPKYQQRCRQIKGTIFIDIYRLSVWNLSIDIYKTMVRVPKYVLQPLTSIEA